jgi:hypothetical protein
MVFDVRAWAEAQLGPPSLNEQEINRILIERRDDVNALVDILSTTRQHAAQIILTAHKQEG